MLYVDFFSIIIFKIFVLTAASIWDAQCVIINANVENVWRDQW